MKILKKRLLYISLLSILLLFLGGNAYAQTVYNWTGNSSTDWETPGNWSVGGVTQTTNYPGVSATDIADIGVNVTCHLKFQPVLGAAESVTIAALNLGDNLVTVGNQWSIQVTINGSLTITGAFTQLHSTVGTAGSANTTGITRPVFNYLFGSGSINCVTFNVGDNTVPAANNVVNVTALKMGTTGAAGSTLNVTVTGNFSENSPGTKDAGNNILSENFAEFSLSAGTLNLYGQIVLTDVATPYIIPATPAGVYSPLAFFSCDLYQNSDSPVLNLYNSSPFSIQTGTNRNNIDFYNVHNSGGTGVITINYAGTGATQDVATWKGTSTAIYNYFIDHNYALTNVIATTSGLTGGSGYVNGTYTNVPLTGGTGAGAMANITVSGGAVTSVTLISGYGGGYTAPTDVLSASAANLGGSGSGFSINVATTTATVTYNGVYQNVTFSGSGTKSSALATGGGTMSVLGNFTVAAGSETVNVSTNTPTLTIGGNLTTGSGATLIKSDGTALTINGTTTNGGTFTHSGAALITYNGAFINQSTGTYSQSGGGNVVFNNYAMNNSGAYNQSSTGTVTINTAFNNNSGGTFTHSGGGAFTAASTTANGGTFNQSSPTVATFTGAVTNTGTMNLTSSGNYQFTAAYTSSGSPGLLSQTGTGNVVFANNVTNGGTISQGSGSVGTIAIAGTLTNSGTFTQQGGAVTVTGALTNNNGGTLNLGSTTFTITSDYTNNGTFTAGTGTAVFNGTSVQHMNDGSTNGTRFSNVLFSGDANKNMQTGAFYVLSTGVMTLSGTKTHVVSSGANNLTFISDINGSATLAALPNNCTVNGTVTVQRYISPNRAYRLLSSPVYAGTDGNGNNYYGVNYLLTNTYLTGTGGTAGGFSKSGNPTLYLWRENLVPQYTTFLNSNFIGIADITNPLAYGMNDATYTTADIPVGNGYLFYFRGSSKQASLATLTTAGAAATTDTLNAVGTLNEGTIVFHSWYQPTTTNLGWSTVDAGNASVQGINLVGNPYPSSIDWDQFSNSSSGAPIYGPNVSGFSFQLIPTGLQGAGNYNVYLAGTPSKMGTQGTPNSNIIASGEGFMVQALNASATLTFNETAKSNTLNTGGNLYMANKKTLAVASVNNFQYLRLQLALDTINTDGTIIRFSSTAKTTFDPSEDAHYRTGTGKVSFASLSSDNQPIAFNQLPLALKGDTIFLKVGASASGTYKINVKELVNIPQLYNVYLVDALMKDTTDLRKTTSYSFTITTTDTTTFGSRRFSLVINQNPSLQYKLLSFTGSQVGESKHVQLNWTTANEQNYTHFTVERSNDNGKTFNVVGGMLSTGAGQYGLVDNYALDGDNQYRLVQVDYNNVTTYSDTIHVQITARGNKDHFTCFPNPAINTINLSFLPKNQDKTTYDVRISNSAGVVVKYAVLTDTNWQGNVSNFLTGTYLIQVVDKKDNSIIGQAKFVKL